MNRFIIWIRLNIKVICTEYKKIDLITFEFVDFLSWFWDDLAAHEPIASSFSVFSGTFAVHHSSLFVEIDPVFVGWVDFVRTLKGKNYSNFFSGFIIGKIRSAFSKNLSFERLY